MLHALRVAAVSEVLASEACPAWRVVEVFQVSQESEGERKVESKDENRGTGVSTRKMLSCSPGSVYVVHSTPQIGYFEALKRKINRPDIEIVTVGQIAGGWALGRIYSSMVVDHYAAENMAASDVPHVRDAVLRSHPK